MSQIKPTREERKKIKKLVKSSKEVFKDCSLENGAIVAANPTKPYKKSLRKLMNLFMR